MTEPLSMSDPAVRDRMNEVVRGLRDALNAEHPAAVVAKSASILHGAISWALDRAQDVKSIVKKFGVDIPLNAPSGKAYSENFATTLGEEIAVPDEWLKPENALILVELLPHEWQHVKQHIDGVILKKWPRMLSHSVLYLAGITIHDANGEEYVGKVEGDSHATNQSVRQFLAGAPQAIDAPLFSIRTSYNLLGLGTGMAESVLKSHYATMRDGGVPNTWSARITREYLYKHAGDLRGRFVL